MAFAQQNRTVTGGLSLDLSAKIYALMTRFEEYRAYRRTVSELSKLNRAELADLGLSHANIESAAHQAVYGTRG